MKGCNGNYRRDPVENGTVELGPLVLLMPMNHQHFSGSETLPNFAFAQQGTRSARMVFVFALDTFF